MAQPHPQTPEAQDTQPEERKCPLITRRHLLPSQQPCFVSPGMLVWVVEGGRPWLQGNVAPEVMSTCPPDRKHRGSRRAASQNQEAPHQLFRSWCLQGKN